jgi:hypothetical protein
MHGKGSYTWPSGAMYTGHYKDDMRSGKGVLILPYGGSYKGDFKNGKSMATVSIPGQIKASMSANFTRARGMAAACRWIQMAKSFMMVFGAITRGTVEAY